MKKLFLLLSAVAISSLYAAESVPEAATVKGTVNVSDFLNVRLGPGLRHPVTGRLNAGQEVEIIRIAGNWLELKAPENLKIYVSEARVNVEGKLTGELNMRSRMDVSAPTYGILPKGAVVKRLDERRNGWVRIAPPADLKVYVAAICVKFDRSKFDEKGIPVTAAESEVKTETPAAEVKAEVPETKAEVKAEVKVETAPETAKIVAKPGDAVPIPETATAAPLKTMTGVAVKWQYAKSEETAIAFLDQPNGKNQAFITGKTPEIQKELLTLTDSGKKFEVSGDYKAVKTPPVFEVSAIKVR
ncbi:MAG: hypothetical protein E7054_02120 [Lentisphaerae bacterium]|nr:hypothetical protein [Lentisphaerota bacterium]